MGYLVPLYVADVSWIYMETSMNWQLIYRGDEVPLNEMNIAIDQKHVLAQPSLEILLGIYSESHHECVLFKGRFQPSKPDDLDV